VNSLAEELIVLDKMDNKLSITAILLLIAGFTYFGIADQEPTHYCLSKEIKGNCLDLSSTGKTCYTLPAKTGGKRCDIAWVEIPFSLSEIPPEALSSNNGKNTIHCTKDGCI